MNCMVTKEGWFLMVRSMTGFGRASSDSAEKRNFSVEIKSINHRYLDLNVRMPRSLMSLEEKVRKFIGEKVNRGKIDVFINYTNYAKSDLVAKFNEALGDSYVKCLESIKARYEVRDDVSVSLIARFPDVVYVEEDEENLDELWEILRTSLSGAVNMLIDMRTREGEKLSEDIIKKCDVIKNSLDKIEEKSPSIVVEYKQKLMDRIKQLIEDNLVDENRINLEVALFADKSSVDEEITRLNSHIIQVRETLKSDEAIGRKLDFLVQEMNREANTIASKANNLEVTNLALNIKNEIEKIREQIQNIE
jgi:uncharacterized protein (TIGR00255 family)